MKRALLAAAAMLWPSVLLFAYSGGITGVTTSGCTCHSSSSSSATSLSLSGPTSVSPGSTTTFTLTLQNSSRPSAGFNLAIVNSGGSNAGTLGAVSGQQTQVINGELTHSSRKSLSGGSVSWQFTWQAPTTPGPYTVRAVGNAVNNNNSADGNDQWNYLQSVTITVKGITITAPTPSQILCAGGQVTLQWTSYGVSSVIVALSSDGGNSFTTIGTLTSQDGQNSQTFTLPTTLPPGNQYRIRLSDASDNTISSTTQNLTVAAPTSITAHPENVSACEGSTATFTVTATGSNLTYQWRRNGTPLTGATQATLTLQNITQAQAGSYDCLVSGACGQATSNAAILTIAPQTTITAHPQSVTVCQGASYTFSVTATGNNLRYQWKKNNQDISGATNSSYTISSVALSDTGLYSCTVTGDCGSPTSNQAQLQVALPPAITSQPQSQTLCEEQNLTLTVSINRAIANGFQWKKNGVNLSDGGRIQGTLTATLRITNLQPDDAGQYTVTITNSVCQASVTSDAATVSVNVKPTITGEPESKTITRGGSATLSVTASGENLQYQWYKNGSALSGATASSYAITNAQDRDSGTYYVVVSNECGSVESRRVTVTITDQPTPVLELSASTVVFSTVRTGVRQEHQLWLYNRGTTALTITTAHISGTDSAAFTVTLSLPVTLQPGDSLAAQVTFTAQRQGSHYATLTVTSNGGNRSAELTGGGLTAALTLSPASLDTTQTGQTTQATVQLCNQTAVQLRIEALSISGPDAPSFQLGSVQLPATVAAGQCISVDVRFTPQRAGTHVATLAVQCSQLGSSFTDELSLRGEAVQGSSVSIEQLGIRILPNPAADVVFFDTKGASATVHITTLLGTTVHESHIVGLHQWHCTDTNGNAVPSGVYLAMLTIGRNTVTVPLVIVR